MERKMKIAAAQIKPIANNTDANIQNHLRMIDLAAQQNVDLIAFPEMSLTGYEREKAEMLLFTEKDARLSLFIEKAKQYQMLIIVGAPIKISLNYLLVLLFLLPMATRKCIPKQFLHDGEELYFSSSNLFNPIIECRNERISLAICADITHPIHAENAEKLDATYM
jgi:predicted amidohydrolase